MPVVNTRDFIVHMNIVLSHIFSDFFLIISSEYFDLKSHLINIILTIFFLIGIIGDKLKGQRLRFRSQGFTKEES